jgi:Helicase conserved C-terminal domain
LSNCYNRQLDFEKKLVLFRKGQGPRPPRPIGGLFSQFWKVTNLPLKRLILDECQAYKKAHGKRFQSVQALYRRATVSLSGTVMNNRWFDVANPIAMLSGHPFDTWEKFMNAFTIATRKTRTTDYDEPDVVSLQRFLLGITVARPSSCLEMRGMQLIDASFTLTTVEEEKVKEATFKYERARRAVAKSGRGNAESSRVLGFAVVAMLLSAHSLLSREDVQDVRTEFLELEADDADDYVITLTQMQSEELNPKSRKEWLNRLDTLDISELTKSSRIRAVIHLIRHIKAKYPGEKVVIFSMFLRFLDIVSRAITAKFGDICLEFNGTMDSEAKNKVQETFNKDEDCQFILITSECGGVGLNLQSGSVVIQCEMWWNRNLELQSYARCHRQGQERDVKVFRILASNSAIDSSVRSCQARNEKENNSIMDVIIRKDDSTLHIPMYPA